MRESASQKRTLTVIQETGVLPNPRERRRQPDTIRRMSTHSHSYQTDFIQDLHPRNSGHIRVSSIPQRLNFETQRPYQSRKRVVHSRLSHRPHSGTTQYDTTEPVPTFSATAADAGHVSSRPTDSSTLASFLDTRIPRTRLTVRPDST